MSESKTRESKSVQSSNAANSSVFFKIGTKKLSISQIRMLMYKYLGTQQYRQLKELFIQNKVTSQQKEDFLLTGGRPLLSYALNLGDNPGDLLFICENFPQEAIRKVLSENEFQLYKDFLNKQLTFDYKSKFHIEKIKTLLLLDPEKTTQLMKDHSDVRIRNNYKIAAESLLKTLANNLPATAAP